MKVIDGLFARAEALSFDLIDLIEENPPAGDAELSSLFEQVRLDLATSPAPLIYRLTGPEPAKSTPMQYGGLFLEKDRELLTLAAKRGEVWLWVDAGPGAYLDFVSDLPADVFCWDSNRTGFSLSQMRELRAGRLCTNEAGSDEDLGVISSNREAQGVAN